jgi:hypothetical protein
MRSDWPRESLHQRVNAHSRARVSPAEPEWQRRGQNFLNYRCQREGSTLSPLTYKTAPP